MMIRRTAMALMAVSSIAFGLTAQAATVGQPAPDFTLSDVNGKTVKLSDFKGKTVVLEWTNPGCPFVRKHYQQSNNMPKLQKEKVDAGVVWLAVNSTEPGHGDYLAPAKMGEWMKERGAAATATLMDADGKVGLAYAAKTTPHMYVVDAKGQLAYAGAIDSIPSAKAEDIPKANNFVRAAVGDIKAGKPVATPTTRPYGCSVKYKS